MSLIIGIFVIVGISTFAVMNTYKISALKTKKVEEKIKQGIPNKVDNETEMNIAEAELKEISSEDIQSSDNNSNTNNQANQNKSTTNSSSKNPTNSSNNTSINRSNTTNSNSNNTTNTQNNTATTQTPQRNPDAPDTSHFNYSIHHGKTDAKSFDECNAKGFERQKKDPNIRNFYCVEVYANSGKLLGYYIDEIR